MKGGRKTSKEDEEQLEIRRKVKAREGATWEKSNDRSVVNMHLPEKIVK
jgi:hypothetical protein